MTRDVVIIGGGPAGGSLAVMLGDLGWDVLLLERGKKPHHKVCGEFMSPESQASLRAMGILDVVEGLSPARITRARLVSRYGAALSVALPGDAFGVSRYALDAALLKAASDRSVEVRTGATARSIQREGEGFGTAVTEGGKTEILYSRAVVAACGRHTRDGLPPKTDPSTNPNRSYVGVKWHYEGLNLPEEVALFFFPGGYAGVAPIEGERVNVCALISRSAFERTGRDVHGAFRAISRWNPALARTLQGGKPVLESAVAVAPVDTARRAAPWQGVPCVGDTAAMLPPLSGDGIAMALRSAELCAPLADDYLRGLIKLEMWEKAYRDAWRRAFQGPLRVSRMLQRALDLPLLSDAFVGLGRVVPSLAVRLVHATRSS